MSPRDRFVFCFDGLQMVERIAHTRPIWSIVIALPRHIARPPTSPCRGLREADHGAPAATECARVERQQPWPAEIARRFGCGVQRLLNTVETSEFLALESGEF